ncbi:MAG: UDP-N-acetylmuramate--L-alanine ligase [Saprospiraceae bacterium]|nr:UDP-N-acetylmuramate--L-alanine ligase [Saprospiraceae bacterium]MDW8229794.1 UDP-N-acetylmuramate--L-alanine ligase [Saprospiraceae bacterium]
MTLADVRTVYFIGIGGIGMSALARYFRHLGAEVHGYDRTETDLTRALAAEGMRIHYEEDVCQIPERVDLVVWTPAVPTDHAELVWLRQRGYPVMKRAEVLGLISRGKRCIAIAGTHGKTTTSSLVAWLLHSAGHDITAFLGGIAVNFHSNFLLGNSDWVVVEADEYDRSFLHLEPEIAVINSLDPDHLDIYGSPEAVVEAYLQFARQIKRGGTLFYKYGLPLDGVAEELRQSGRRAFTFGIGVGNCQASDLHVQDGYMVFNIHARDQFELYRLQMPLPGRHNVENALAAWMAAATADIWMIRHMSALEKFQGVRRRFEYIVRRPDLVYVDDYAHHPAEIRATVQAARMFFPDKKITGVFQPHLYSRTRDFADAFAEALDELDTCYLLPIYPAREQPIPGVSSELIFDKMNLADRRLTDKEGLLRCLADRRPEVLLTMGAGDIDALVKPIAQQLNP